MGAGEPDTASRCTAWVQCQEMEGALSAWEEDAEGSEGSGRTPEK